MVEILMAVYNGESYLKEQLESIAAQTYTDWHLIIRDDCSKDASLAVIREFKHAHPQLRIDIYENETPTGSACKNFMRLLRDAREDYIMFCDQDDIWLPFKVMKTYKAMKHVEREEGTDQKPFLIHSDLIVADEAGQTIAKSMRAYQQLPKTSDLRQLLIQNMVTGCTVMINRPLLKLLLMAEHEEAVVMHDYWAALIAQTFGRIYFIKRPLILYRQHGDNSVGAMNARGPKYLFGRMKAGRSQFRDRLLATMAQAEAFARIYRAELAGLPEEALIRDYGALAHSGKMQKISFYTSKGVLKYGSIRVIMQYLWS